jgi:DNA polymerase-3 subunit delta'
MNDKKIKEFLTATVEKQKIANAYLLYGGTEEIRKEIGIFFAQSLNCSKSPSVCKTCLSCRNIENDIHPDIKWIIPEKSVLSINEVRQIKEEIYIKPYLSKFKIFFIKINWMRPEAANSLLKILEEPPDYGIIFILSRTIYSLIPTIVSRCIKLKLNSVLEVNISEKEKNIIDEIITARDKKNWRNFFFLISKTARDLEREEIEIFLENIIFSMRPNFMGKNGLKQTDINVIENIMEIKNRLRYNVNSRILLETIFSKI